MVQLILVRHAKSDWGDPGLADHECPINNHGLRDAPVTAARCAESGVEVQRIISSTAVRARTTAAGFGAAFDRDIELDSELYLASAETLLATAAAAGAASVMLVAHDPGLSDLERRLSGGGVERIPTCAVAWFQWEARSWSEVERRAADDWWCDRLRPRRTERGILMTEKAGNTNNNWYEEFKVGGDELLAKVREIIEEGNARRLYIKRDSGETIFEIPLTAGVAVTAASALLAPILVAVGAIAALATSLTIGVERPKDDENGTDSKTAE